MDERKVRKAGWTMAATVAIGGGIEVASHDAGACHGLLPRPPAITCLLPASPPAKHEPHAPEEPAPTPGLMGAHLSVVSNTTSGLPATLVVSVADGVTPDYIPLPG
jgi:hypothetical protein